MENRKFLCPKCGSLLEMITRFTGWDVETISPELGEPTSVDESGRSEVHEIEVRCSGVSMGTCDWSVGEDGWEEFVEGEWDGLSPRPGAEDFRLMQQRYAGEDEQ